MHTMAIDIESFSSEDITKVGMYKYFEAMDFEISLWAHQIDNGPVIQYDLANGDELPVDVLEKLNDPLYLKTAHNAPFEIGAIETHFNIELDRSQWECTMVKAAMMGYPLSLDAVTKAMRLDIKKNPDGKALIRFFCVPVKPTKVNGMKFRNTPADYPAKWEKFKRYNRDDVTAERAVANKVRHFKIPEREKQIWLMDQRINARGVRVEMQLVNEAIAMDEEHKAGLVQEAKLITGLSNPNSLDQLKGWLASKIPGFAKIIPLEKPELTYDHVLHTEKVEVPQLRKDDVDELLKTITDPPVRRMLELRQEMSKTSIKKYTAIRMAVCDDGRLRGLFQFYGANRTGRWAGRLTQVHNLVRNFMDTAGDRMALDRARRIVMCGGLSLLDLLHSVPDTLSQLIRTAFIPDKGKTLLVSDLAAIEARILAWLAGEKWRMDVFNSHGKIYEASGAQMFGVPIEAVTKDSEYRQKSKISELALGYQGSVGALLTMGALKMGLKEEELPMIVKLWRKANPAIVKYWYTIQDAAIEAVKNPGRRVNTPKGVSFERKGEYMYVHLPSGRHLTYVRPRIYEGEFGDTIAYDGMNQTTKVWGKQETYGGKLVENIVQAIARDILAEQMLILDEREWSIVMHVHDEVVIDYEHPELSEWALEEVNKILSRPVSWAPQLPLKAAGFVNSYYKKD